MPGIDLLVFATVMDVVRGSIMTLFVISAFLVILVVLAQEGKGGGLAGAFGGAGSETFGVKAGTVNTFTAWIGAAFLGLALLYAGLSTAQSAPKKGVDTMQSLPGDTTTDDGSAPAKDGETPKDDAGSKDEPKDDAGSKDEPKDDAGSKDEPKDDAGSKDEPKDDAGSKDEPKDDAKPKDEPKDDGSDTKGK